MKTNGIVKELQAQLQAYKDACNMQPETLKSFMSEVRRDFDLLKPYCDDSTPRIADGVKLTINHLQKQLQEARAACNMYENELIELRKQVDDMMLDGSDETTAPVQPLDNLNIADDDDTKEMGVEPVDSRWIPHSDALMTWQTFIHELDNGDDS